jgi:hypothetical protein
MSLTFLAQALGLALGLFVGMLAAIALGRRLGARRLRLYPGELRVGVAPVEAAVFGLLGLVLALTFNSAATRFDTRRQLVVQEANAIGTAWLRLDLLPADAQPALREAFRRYVDARLLIYRLVSDGDDEAAWRQLAVANGVQREIWSQAETACLRDPRPAVCTLTLPALNEMIDVTTTRVLATQSHSPTAVFVLLVIVALLGAVVAGYAMAETRARPWLHQAALALLTSLTLYVIYDLEYPRRGLIRVEHADRMLADLRSSMD